MAECSDGCGCQSRLAAKMFVSSVAMTISWIAPADSLYHWLRWPAFASSSGGPLRQCTESGSHFYRKSLTFGPNDSQWHVAVGSISKLIDIIIKTNF